jgi:hypothetical protein
MSGRRRAAIRAEWFAEVDNPLKMLDIAGAWIVKHWPRRIGA